MIFDTPDWLDSGPDSTRLKRNVNTSTRQISQTVLEVTSQDRERRQTEKKRQNQYQNMRNFRRRNAISAYSTSHEALALRTFSRFLQTCHRRGGIRGVLPTDSFIPLSSSSYLEEELPGGGGGGEGTDPDTPVKLTSQPKRDHPLNICNHCAPAA